MLGKEKHPQKSMDIG